MKKLSIEVSTLSKIIYDGYAYVDKTPMVHQLVESGMYYFLSRPRRFGKSLFIDTQEGYPTNCVTPYKYGPLPSTISNV
jgi:hypothetical protein